MSNDIWVLMPKSVWIDPQQRDQLIVHAIDHDGLRWQTRETLDWMDFRGSQQALGSLSLPETRVILALPTGTNAQARHQGWLGLENSPHRLVNAPHCPWHDSVKAEFKNMAADWKVCISDTAPQAVSSAPLTCVSGIEQQVLTTWANDIQTPDTRAHLQALALLTFKPGRRRQMLRVVGLTLTLILCIAAQAFQAGLLKKQRRQALQSAIQRISEQKKPNTPWADWQEQVAKFGQNNRANLTDLSFQWRLNDPVQSTVTLARPRKRLPKGCEFVAEHQAHCVAEPPVNSRFRR